MDSGRLSDRALQELRQNGPIALLRHAGHFARHHPGQLLTQLVWLRYHEVGRDALPSVSETFYEYGPAEAVKYAPPDQPEYNTLFDEYSGPWELTPSFVAAIEDVTLLPPYGVGLLEAEPAFLAETYDGMPNGLHRTILANFDYFAPNPFGSEPDYETLDMATSVVRVADSFNYGNAVLEELPRLHGVKRYEEITGMEIDVIVKAGSPAWLIELYRRVGIDEDRLIDLPERPVQVEKFVLPTRRKLGDKYRADPERRTWVRDQLAESAGVDVGSAGTDRLYISRQSYGTRYVENFGELRPVLDEFGFTVIEPERLPIAEQFERFSTASIMIGPWGTGFTNAIFATDVTLVTFLPPDYLKPDFYLLAKEFGHRYRYLVGSLPHGSAEDADVKDSPFRISPDKLREVLSRVIDK